MKELDQYDFERAIAQARRERSIALGNIIAEGFRALARAIVSLVTLRAPHHRMPTA